MEAHEQSAGELLSQARDLEDAERLEEAFTLYLRAADAFQKQPGPDNLTGENGEAFALMRAGQCLEMLQPWRAHTAVWERLGNLLGNSINSSIRFRTPSGEGQHNLYHIISYTEWLEGAQNADLLGRLSWRRQQQAWSYSWAAEEAEANNRYVLAARLYRKAGNVWVVNARQIREQRLLEGKVILGSKDPEHRNLLQMSGPWLEGARCFYKASLCAQSSGDAETLSRVIDPWVPEENEWGRSTDEEITTAGGHSDLELLEECWENYLGLTKQETQYTVSRSDQASGLESLARQLSEIQRGYARMGERRRAIMVYRQRQRIVDRAHSLAGHYVRSAVQRIYLWTTGSGSSMARSFLTVGLAYLLVFPAVFYFWSQFKLSNTQSQPSFADAVVFSIGNVVSVTSTRYLTPSLAVSAMQSIEAVTGYLALGYIVWLALRSYEQ